MRPVNVKAGKDKWYKGHEDLWNEIRQGSKMWIHTAEVCLAVQLAAYLLCMFVITGPERMAFTVKYFLAKLAHAFFINPTFSMPYKGHIITATAADIASSAASAEVMKYFWLKTSVCGLISCVAWLIAPFLLRRYHKRSTELISNEHIRGPKMLESEELIAEIKEKALPSRLNIGGIPIPIANETKHFFIAGSTGSMKTQPLYELLAQIRNIPGGKGIVHDFKGEFIEKFYNPKTDIILSFLDVRGTGWTISNEFRTLPDIISVGASLFPLRGDKNDHFRTSAASVYVDLCSSMLHDGDFLNKDAWAEFRHSPKDWADRLRAAGDIVGGGLAYVEKDDSNMAASTKAVMMASLEFYRFAAEAEGEFSIQNWLDRKEGGLIFMVGQLSLKDTLAPLYSLFIDQVGKKLLSMKEDEDRRVFFILEELGMLTSMPIIPTLLTEGRTKGASVWCIVQDFVQVIDVFSENKAATVINNCHTQLFLKMKEKKTTEFFSSAIGKSQFLESQENASWGVSDGKDGGSISKISKIEELVMSSEFGLLKAGEGFLCVADHMPTRVQLTYVKNKFPTINEMYIERPGAVLVRGQSKAERLALAAEIAKDDEMSFLSAVGTGYAEAEAKGLGGSEDIEAADFESSEHFDALDVKEDGALAEVEAESDGMDY